MRVALNPSMLLQIIETMPHTENVEKFLEQLGDFYEMIDDGTDGRLSRRMKRESPQQDLPVKNGDVVNGARSSADSSPETSDTLHSQSDLSSHSVTGVCTFMFTYCVVFWVAIS